MDWMGHKEMQTSILNTFKNGMRLTRQNHCSHRETWDRYFQTITSMSVDPCSNFTSSHNVPQNQTPSSSWWSNWRAWVQHRRIIPESDATIVFENTPNIENHIDFHKYHTLKSRKIIWKPLATKILRHISTHLYSGNTVISWLQFREHTGKKYICSVWPWLWPNHSLQCLVPFIGWTTHFAAFFTLVMTAVGSENLLEKQPKHDKWTWIFKQ